MAQRYREFAQRCSIGFLFEALGITSSCETAYKQSGNPRLLIEFALMKLCNLTAHFAADQAAVAVAPASAPAAARVATPAAAPVQAPAPASKPAAPSRPTGLSLKAMMAEARQEPAAAPAQPTASAEKPAPTAESLAAAWKALAASEERRPQLSSAIAQATPRLEEDKTLHFEVGNLAQKDWIDRNCRARLEAFLQKQLADPAIRLVVDVKKIEETGRGMYMPSDKAKFLQETSPEFNGLQKDLGLEIS